MKCDKLKPLVFSLKDFAYIDEPAANKNFENPHAHAVYKATEVDAAIDELKTEHHKERHEYIKMIAGLKQKLQDQCISCPVKMQEDDVVAEKDDEIRRLKRALYKACANWAHHRVFVRFKTNEMAWENVERKCRAKAEENK